MDQPLENRSNIVDVLQQRMKDDGKVTLNEVVEKRLEKDQDKKEKKEDIKVKKDSDFLTLEKTKILIGEINESFSKVNTMMGENLKQMELLKKDIGTINSRLTYIENKLNIYSTSYKELYPEISS